MAFLRNIFFCRSDVSLPRYETSKFDKNAFFTKSAAVHNFYIANAAWNLNLNSKSHKIWKNEKGMTFLRNILFCLSDVSLQRYDSANRRPILEKNTFSHSWQLYTVTQAAHMFGWWWGVEGGPAYVGWPRIKRSLFFFKLFLESQNHREKLNLWTRNWVLWQDNFLKED